MDMLSVENRFIRMQQSLMFFFYITATTEIYTLSLHEALEEKEREGERERERERGRERERERARVREREREREFGGCCWLYFA